MRFICQREDLTQALGMVTRAIAVRSPMPELECVLVRAGEDGIHLLCTDLQMGIKSAFPATVEEEGQVLLPGRLFSEIIRKLPEGELTLSVNDKHAAVIRCQGSRTTLQGMDAEKFPQLPQVEGERPILVKQALLRDMIRQTSFAIAQDDSRPILTGCLVEVEGEEIRLVALDGFRLALRRGKLEQPADAFSAVVSGKYFSELGRILGEEDRAVSLSFSQSHLLADLGATVVVVRLLDGEYIKYRQLLPAQYQISVRVERAALGECIERASLMAKEGKNNLLRFLIGQETMTITSNSEMGDVHEELPVQTCGKEIEIAFNVRYISEAIKNLDGEQFLLKLNTNISPCVLVPTEGEDFLYLVLPVRTYASR